MVLTAVILARVYWVGTDTTYAASAGRQTTQTTELPRARGNFLDRTDRPLTGTDTTRYALCVPGDNSYSALLPYVSYQAQTLLYERRNSTSPFLVEIGQTGAPANVLLLDQPRRTLPSPIAVHLLGYLDQEGRGVTGLERAWDAVLANSCDQTAAVCRTTARGRLLGTGTPEIITEQQGTGAQVQLTLDVDIQRLCEGLAQLYMPRGCILVMDTATGEVLASVSMPEYDPDDVARSIRADDTSLVNRTFSTFSVGSVFKVAAALAAYENGLDWFTHDCTSSIEVDGQTYRCALGKAHGTVNLRCAGAKLQHLLRRPGPDLGRAGPGHGGCRIRLWHRCAHRSGPDRQRRGAAHRQRTAKHRPAGGVQLRAGQLHRHAPANHRHDEHHRRGWHLPHATLLLRRHRCRRHPHRPISTPCAPHRL